MPGFVKIMITDFVEDPIDDSAFGIRFEVQWPGTDVDYPRISFEEEFIEKIFKVPWNLDLGVQDKKLAKEQRETFIRFALLRLELWIERKEDVSKMQLTLDKHGEWAKQVVEASTAPLSEKIDDSTYRYWLKD